METMLILTLFSQLTMDENFSIYIFETCIKTLLSILLDSHPRFNTCQCLNTISEKKEEKRNEFQANFFRLMRLLYTIEKNRKVSNIYCWRNYLLSKSPFKSYFLPNCSWSFLMWEIALSTWQNIKPSSNFSIPFK